MDHYVGLDVSLKQTHFCVVDGSGAVVVRGYEATHPELLAAVLRRHAPCARVVVLETGGQSSWLHGALASLALPAETITRSLTKRAAIRQQYTHYEPRLGGLLFFARNTDIAWI